MTALPARGGTAGLRCATDVAVAATRIWWRRLGDALGRVVARILLVLAVVGAVGLWLVVWRPVRDTVRSYVSGRPEVDGVLVVAVLLGYLMVCAVVRVLLLAFDSLSRDLRLLLAPAPLGRVTRGLLQVVPDMVVSGALSLGLGAISLLGFADASPQVAIGEALLWALAGVAVVGALSAAVEAALTALTRDNMAARGGAAVVVLAVVAVSTALTASSLQGGPLDGPVAHVGTALLQVDPVTSGTVAVLLALVAAAAWVAAAATTTREIFRTTSRRPLLDAAAGGFVVASALSFLRNPHNRIGLVGLGVLASGAVALERTSHLPVAGVVVVGLGVMALAAAVLVAWGDYGQLRWRVRTSPVDARRVAAAWIGGHLLGAGVVWAVLVGLLVAAHRDTVASATPDAVVDASFLLVVTLASSVVAGRLVPYSGEDVLTVLGTGLVAAACAAAGWWVCTSLDDHAHVPRLATALLLLSAALAGVVGAEGAPRRVRAS